MILEVAILNIKEGAEIDFENDFKNASKFISAIKGYLNHSLSKCIEQKNKYLLLVNWDTLNDHTIGFRQSNNTSNGNVYCIPITTLFQLWNTMIPYIRTPKLHLNEKIILQPTTFVQF